MSEKYFSAKKITGLAVLLALVIVLQALGGYFKIGGTSLSFVLVPIVLGSILYGPLAGAILGFAFGVVVWIYGLTGADGFTAILLADHPIWTTVLCLGKGTAAGAAAGWTFRLLSKKNAYVGTFAAAVVTPVVNTGLFILGALVMSGTLKANFVDGTSVIYFLVVVCAGINFLVELAINLVCSPAVYTVIRVVSKGKIK